MHLRRRANLWGSSIDSENERENNRKQDRGMCAVEGVYQPWSCIVLAHGQLTSRRVASLACRQRRRRWQHQVE